MKIHSEVQAGHNLPDATHPGGVGLEEPAPLHHSSESICPLGDDHLAGIAAGQCFAGGRGWGGYPGRPRLGPFPRQLPLHPQGQAQVAQGHLARGHRGTERAKPAHHRHPQALHSNRFRIGREKPRPLRYAERVQGL